MSASDTTLRRKQRTLFADRVVQQTTFDNTNKNHVLLEGGRLHAPMTYAPHYYNMVVGAVETTPEEQLAYIDSVPGSKTVPDAPTAVVATAGNAQATVAFVAPVNNGGYAITSYTVTSSPGGFTSSGSTSPIIVTGLTNGTSYTFTVIATNSVGNSAASSPSTAVVPATIPNQPTSVSATAGNAQATVTFTAPGNNGGDAITSYAVTSSPGGFTSTGSASPIIVTGLTNGTSYTFTVIATNSVGNSAASSASNSVTPVVALTRALFTSGSGTFEIPSGVTSIDYLVVGGGGGGGAGSGTGAGGGGGGGSVKTGKLSVTPGDVISYSVGSGGAGGTTPDGGETNGASGVDSVFGIITAKGGGLGYKSREVNTTGLFGQGGAAQSGDTPTTGGSGGYVRDGGANSDQGAGGGGGGAGGAGVTSVSGQFPNDGFDNNNNRGGAGGLGFNSDLKDGTVQMYGRGGKGADEGTPEFIGTRPGANGAANTGNGGGGGASHWLGGNAAVGGDGGSGIIVIAF